MPLLVALLGAPQGLLVLDAPSPKGSLSGEVSEGGAGEPQASSVLSGAASRCRGRRGTTIILMSNELHFALSKYIAQQQVPCPQQVLFAGGCRYNL